MSNQSAFLESTLLQSVFHKTTFGRLDQVLHAYDVHFIKPTASKHSLTKAISVYWYQRKLIIHELSLLLTNPSGREHDFAPTNFSVSVGTPVSQTDNVFAG